MHDSVFKQHAFMARCALFLFAAPAASSFAQLGGLGDKLKNKTPSLLAGKAPITTSLPDAKWGDAAKDGFTPRAGGAVSFAVRLKRQEGGRVGF